MDTRKQNIEHDRAIRRANQLGNALAAELVDYGRGGKLRHAKEAMAKWPVAHAFFDKLRHGEAVTEFSHEQVQDVFGRAYLHRTAPEPAPIDTVKAVQAHGRGLGWGHYPILKEGPKTGCKVTWRVKSGAAVAKRTIIPVSKEHAAIVRKCNQLIVEAEQGALHLSRLSPDEWKLAKGRWKRRQDVRYMAMPQLDGFLVVHNGQVDGAAPLGPLCEGYGKAALYELVGEWLAGRPSTTKKTAKGLTFAYVRVGTSKDWGRHYSGSEGKSKNIKANTALAAHSTHPSSTLAAAVRGTVDANGRGSDMTTSVKADMETFLQLGLIPTLTAEQLDTMNELEAVLIAAAAVPTVADELFSTVDTAAKSYTLTHETTAAPSPLPAKNGRPSRLRPSHGGASC